MQAGKGLAGLLIGGIIGSAVALLFAPKRGKEVRENIKGNYDDMISKTKVKSRRLFNHSLDIVDDIIKKSDELRALIKKYKEGTFDETVEKIENEIKRLRLTLLTAIETYKNSKQGEDSSDELVNNIYQEFKSEPATKKKETTI